MRTPSASGVTEATRADAVDVPLDVVAAERVAGAQRGLQVDARAERLHAGERLRDDVEREPPAAVLDDGQADAVDRDRVAELRRQRRLDDEPAVVERRRPFPLLARAR